MCTTGSCTAILQGRAPSRDLTGKPPRGGRGPRGGGGAGLVCAVHQGYHRALWPLRVCLPGRGGSHLCWALSGHLLPNRLSSPERVEQAGHRVGGGGECFVPKALTPIAGGEEWQKAALPVSWSLMGGQPTLHPRFVVTKIWADREGERVGGLGWGATKSTRQREGCAG